MASRGKKRKRPFAPLLVIADVEFAEFLSEATTYRRFILDRNWDPVGFGSYERNDELGLVATRENEVDALESDDSVEALAAVELDWFRYDDPELDFSMRLSVFERLSDTRRTRGGTMSSWRGRVTSATLRLGARLVIGLGLCVTACQTTDSGRGRDSGSFEAGPDPRNMSFVLDELRIELVDGTFTAPAAPGSSSMIRTRIWGEPLLADLNADGTVDAVLILAHQTGGTGTFFYLVAAIGSQTGYVGTRGLFLGDRIDPQRITVDDDAIAVSYLTRDPDQAMAGPPRTAVTRAVTLSPDGSLRFR